MYDLPKSYRLYWFDIARRVVTADFVIALTDEEAIAKTKAMANGSKCEILHGKRLVALLQDERASGEDTPQPLAPL